MDTTTARALSSRLADLLSREHVAMADFLAALADFDRRRLWEPLGYTSLWLYLTRELQLSRSAAFYRAAAADLLQRIPEAAAALRDGRLCLSSVAELARVVTPDNAAEVLPRFYRLSAREARDVVAELAPKAVVPQRVVVTPMARGEQVLTSELTQRHVEPRPLPATPASTPTPDPTPDPIPIPSPRPTIAPITADRSRLHVTVSRRFLEKLEAARDALSHAKPGADAEAILEAGLDLILARQAKRRAQVQKPRKPKAAASPALEATEPASVPAEVRRAVWARDEGRCQWRLDSGHVCGSTHRLELDHVVPRARGGPSTVENLRVLCRHHNQLAARLALGERWMARYLRPAEESGSRLRPAVPLPLGR